MLSTTAASESGKVALLQQQPSQDQLGDHGVIGIKQHDAHVVDQAADLQHDAASAQTQQVDADESDSQPADSRPTKLDCCAHKIDKCTFPAHNSMQQNMHDA